MKILPKSEKFCMSCGKSSKDEELYYCDVHKRIFCNECMNPKGKRVRGINEGSKCHRRYFITDFSNKMYHNEIQDNCIYHKMPLFKEKEEEK